MTIREWLTQRPPRSKWRKTARAYMQREVDVYLAERPTIDRKELLALVDAVYPFGERRYEPYKCWLKERRALIEVLDLAELPAPDADDRAACEVAVDLVCLLRVDDATRLMDEQAPRRLNRPCPACKARIRKPCVDEHGSVLAVPHASRLGSGSGNGPLFGAVP